MKLRLPSQATRFSLVGITGFLLVVLIKGQHIFLDEVLHE
jgi:hypothetical protein